MNLAEIVVPEKAVNRLSELRAAEREEDFAEGQAEGLEWAQDEATPRELRLVADHEVNGDYCQDYMEKLHEALGSAVGDERLAQMEETEADDYLRGFVSAARAVWNKVRHRL